MIGFMAATAQAQAEATKEAQRAGIEHDRAKGEGYLGRKPTYTRATLEPVCDRLAQGTGIAGIAKETGLSRQAIYRIKEDRAGAEATLAAWGM